MQPPLIDRRARRAKCSTRPAPHIRLNEVESPTEPKVGSMALAGLVHHGQQMRQEAATDLGRAAQTRLDSVRAPGRVTTQEMDVEIDECTVLACDLGDDSVYAAVVLTSQLGIDAREVEGVVAE